MTERSKEYKQSIDKKTIKARKILLTYGAENRMTMKQTCLKLNLGYTQTSGMISLDMKHKAIDKLLETLRGTK